MPADWVNSSHSDTTGSWFPSTAHWISRRSSTAFSTSTRALNWIAWVTALASSAGPAARAMPTLEPATAGLTTTG